MTETPASGATIEIRGLSKEFGTFRAVDDVSFDVHPGRITGFLGPNGAGKTILVSSHLLQEVEQTVDDVVIISNGRLVRSGAIAELHGPPTSLVRTSEPNRLIGALRVSDIEADLAADDPTAVIAVTEDLRLVGDVAHRSGLPVWQLNHRASDLESVYFELTEGTNRNLGATADASSPAPTEGADR